MFHFQHINFLFFLAAILLAALLFFYALARKKAALKKIGEPFLVKQLIDTFNPKAYLAKFLMTILVIGLIVIALCNPRRVISEQKINRDGIDVMLALDVSKSMLGQDIQPSRLERAKQVFSRLIDKLGNDRVGIVIFAGRAYLQMPLTSDYSAAKMYLAAATTESVPTQGTIISDALKMCNASFNAKEKKYKAVILISDGEDHEKKADKAAAEMAASGVVVYTVGIGSPEGATLTDENTNELKKDIEGNTVVSKLNEAALQAIASKGNGSYFLFTSTDAIVSAITSQLSSMDQRQVKDDSLIDYRSYFQYFVAAALLVLIIEIFIAERKTTKNVFKKLRAGITILFFFITTFSYAQNENSTIQKGNDAYRKNELEKASDAYSKVLEKNNDNAIAHFNRGNAMYKIRKKEAALDDYEQAANHFSTAPERANAFYNTGVVLQNDNKISACIDAYKNSLKLVPGNEDARQNLQKALQQQKKEQEKKQQDQKKNKQDQKDQQQPEPKPPPSRLTKQDAENKLKALMQQEKNLQDKLHKVNPASLYRPEKDW